MPLDRFLLQVFLGVARFRTSRQLVANLLRMCNVAPTPPALFLPCLDEELGRGRAGLFWPVQLCADGI